LENEIQDVLSEMWQEACENGRTVSFKIVSGSMSPVIQVGDIVQVSRVDPSKIGVGDIVAFRQDAKVMVHRVSAISRSNGGLRFRQGGDAGSTSLEIAARSLIGRIGVIKREGRDIRLDSPKQIISNKIFGYRLRLLDTLSRGRHQGILAGLWLLVRPPWRLCRTLLLRHPKKT
jgi:hypothetical protein